VPVHEVDPLSVKTSKALSYLRTHWTGNCVCVAGMRDTLLGCRKMSNLQSNIKNAAPLIKIKTAGSLVFEHADDFMPKALDILR